ncbi:MAG: hypothetical protein GY773_21645, partial [Actinomycetia bacterium]|nr:hypothetical protein [Actinomycetes bacterium]
MNAYAKAPPHVEAIARVGRIRAEIVVVAQDFGGAGEFSQEFPERHFDVG